MLKLKRKEVTMPTKINVRGEFHGEVTKTAVDIVLRFAVDRSEMSDLLRRSEAWRDYFEEKAEGHFEPKYAGITNGIKVLGRFENSKAKFLLGVDMHEVEIENGTVHNIEIDPQVGGMSIVTLTMSALQTEPMKALQDYLGPQMTQKVNLSIGKLKEKSEKEKAEDAQSELPLGEGSPSSPDAAIEQDQRDQALADAAPQAVTDGESPYAAQTKRKRNRVKAENIVTERAAKKRVRNRKSKAE